MGRCLGSIMTQTFTDFEVIVVDDGSTDETQEVVKEWEAKDSRITYFQKVNEERSIARNFGIDRANGKYVNFLDSDDVMYPQHFETAYRLLARHQFPEVGHLGFEIVDSLGKSILTRNNFDHSVKEKLIHDNVLHCNAIFIRNEVAKAIRFIDSPFAILAEDWYVWLRLAARYPIYFDNSITSAVIQHEGRSLKNVDPDRLTKNTEVIVSHLQRDSRFLESYKGKVNYHFANHFTFLTLTLALSKKRRIDTFRYLVKAIQYDPTVVFRRRFMASLKHLV